MCDHSCFGRDHAHQRIDLYPVEGHRLRTTITIHVSRSLKGAGSDQTISGLRRAIDFPGRQPALPYQRQALEFFFDPLVSSLERRAFRYDTLLDEPPQGDRQFAGEPSGLACPSCRTARATNA
jgi:hypothetical protein